MPVDTGADLDVFLLVTASVGEVRDEVVGHKAQLKGVVEVVVDSSTEGVGKAGGVAFEGAGGGVRVIAGGSKGETVETLDEEASPAIPYGGSDMAFAVSVADAAEKADLVDVDLLAEVGDGHAIEGDGGTDAVPEVGAVVDGGSAKVEIVGGGASDELGTLLSERHAEVGGLVKLGLDLGSEREERQREEEYRDYSDSAEHRGRPIEDERERPQG